MKVLITGGTGFIGGHLVRALAEHGHHPITLSRRPAGLPGVPHISADVGSVDAFRAVDGVDAIVHLAGLSNASESLGRPVEYVRVNAMGTLNMLEAARKCGARLLLASSQRVYRPSVDPLAEDAPLEPQDPYGYSKLFGERWAEMYTRFYGVPTVVLRFFSVYGPGLMVTSGASGVAGIFVARALRGEPIIAHADQRRDLTYVTDVVAGMLLALERPTHLHCCYNVATGVGTSMEELAEITRRVARSRSEIRVERSAAFGHLVADISRARQELGYSPRVDLEEGLERYIAWYRANS